MQIRLEIATITLEPDNNPGQVFDMTGRCAFAICTKGSFAIKILNEKYIVSTHCMFACMPFVNIEVVEVSQPSEVIFGFLQIEDVPMMINQWINTNNLIAIQNRPLVEITDINFCRLTASINEYLSEYREIADKCYNNTCSRIQQDIINFRSSLILAQVIRIYFANIQLEVGGHTQRDIVFLRFMLALYGNYREHRNVNFYAMRSGVSLKYFSTIVRQLSGKSPSDWIEIVVVGGAKSMLTDINRSIKDIATTLNFPDAPTFTKYFLRVTGLTPKAYRTSIQ